MRRAWISAMVVAGVVAAACSSHGSSTGSTNPTSGNTTTTGQPGKATDIGISPTEIRIGVIADVNTPFAPGLFQGSIDAVKGFADWINRNGGLAGRQVRVDAVDTKLSADETKNALISACGKDFALVGDTALFENNVDPILQCKDINGAATGMPEIPELTTDPVQQASRVSFPINPPQRDYSAPGFLVHTGVGQYRWFAQNVTKDLHGIWIYAHTLASTQAAETWITASAVQSGFLKLDQTFNFVGLEPKAAYDPVINAIKSHNTTLVNNGLDVTGTVKMRQEAAIQGVTSVKVWDCVFTCYDPQLIKLGGNDVEGQYITSNIVPFEEADAAKGVKEYLDAVGPDKANGFGAQAWLASLFFRDVVNAIVSSDGTNGVTRSSFFAAAKNQHAFTGDNMTSPTDIGGRKGTGCFMIIQVKNGKFTRVYPAEKGKFDCSPDNLVTLTSEPPGG